MASDKKKNTPVDFHVEINRILEAKGLSKTWLANEVNARYGTARETVFRFLRGEHDTNSKTLAKMLLVLKIRPDMTSV